MPEIVCRIVEVCVFKMGRSGPEYLLLKRSDNDKIYPGIWQIVTGSIERGERAVDAALRELKEETGMTAHRFWNVPHVNTFYVTEEDAIHHTVFFAAEVHEHSESRLSGEHETFRWLKVEDAKSIVVWPGQKRGLEMVHEYIVGGKQAATFLEIKPVET